MHDQGGLHGLPDHVLFTYNGTTKASSVKTAEAGLAIYLSLWCSARNEVVYDAFPGAESGCHT